MELSYKCPRCGCGLSLERSKLRSEIAQSNMESMVAKLPFTSRERATVLLVIEGLRNCDIAARMGNTEQVIKNRLRRIYDVAGVSNRAELIAKMTLGQQPQRISRRSVGS